MSDSVRPYGLLPARLMGFTSPWDASPWDSPGKNTGVGCHFLTSGDIPDPKIEAVSLTSPALAGRQILYH